jgi:hypothetical protein
VFDPVKPHPALVRLFDPPLDVWVHLREIYRAWLDPEEKMDPPPGWLVDRHGVPLPLKLPGAQTARVRLRQGTWLLLVSYSLPTELDLGPIRMSHLFPERAVTRRWSDTEGGEPF